MSTTAAAHNAADRLPIAHETPPQAAELRMCDAEVRSLYANFCRITGTPEEILIDFGLNMQPFETPAAPLAATQRIVVNYYTAKRMLHALGMVLERYEAAFGAVEVNVQRRVRQGTQ